MGGILTTFFLVIRSGWVKIGTQTPPIWRRWRTNSRRSSGKCQLAHRIRSVDFGMIGQSKKGRITDRREEHRRNNSAWNSSGGDSVTSRKFTEVNVSMHTQLVRCKTLIMRNMKGMPYKAPQFRSLLERPSILMWLVRMTTTSTQGTRVSCATFSSKITDAKTWEIMDTACNLTQRKKPRNTWELTRWNPDPRK